MRLGTKIIIIGFILFAIGIVGVEVTAQNLSHEPRVWMMSHSYP